MCYLDHPSVEDFFAQMLEVLSADNLQLPATFRDGLSCRAAQSHAHFGSNWWQMVADKKAQPSQLKLG